MVEKTALPNETTMTSQSEQDYLGVKQVAANLNVSKATILRWLGAGKFDGFFRIGRKWLIRKSDFEKFINQKVVEEINKQSP